MKGKKRTQESKDKFSKTMKEYNKTHPGTNTGKHHTEATKRKISDTCRYVGVGKWNKGRPSKKKGKRYDNQICAFIQASTIAKALVVKPRE
jgi:hypothetical protein